MAQLCAMCEKAEAKYKCPTCRVPYCSLVCCKQHKETPCERVPAPEKKQEPPTLLQGTAPVPFTVMLEDKENEKLTDEQMAVLRTSVEVKGLLANPAITQVLTQIDSSQDKIKALEKALLDPMFAKFVYHALDEVVLAK